MSVAGQSAKQRKPVKPAPWVPRIVLGNDPGKKSGAAIVSEGRHEADGLELLGSWPVAEQHHALRSGVCELFASEAQKRSAFPLVGAEHWSPGGRFGVNEAASCGTSFGMWRMTLCYEFPSLAESQVFRWKPTKWKSEVLGCGTAKGDDGVPKWIEVARCYLGNLFVKHRAMVIDMTVDELAAVCIALHTLRSVRPTSRAVTAYRKRLQEEQ